MTISFPEEELEGGLLAQFGEDCFVKLKRKSSAAYAAGALLSYLKTTQKRGLEHINQIILDSESSVMHLDLATRRNLELTETIRDHKKRGSLLSVLDNTTTCMGGRLFRSWLSSPLQMKRQFLKGLMQQRI